MEPRVRIDLIRGRMGEYPLKLRVDKFAVEAEIAKHFGEAYIGERHGHRGLLVESRPHLESFLRDMQAKIATGEITSFITGGIVKALIRID